MIDKHDVRVEWYVEYNFGTGWRRLGNIAWSSKDSAEAVVANLQRESDAADQVLLRVAPEIVHPVEVDFGLRWKQ